MKCTENHLKSALDTIREHPTELTAEQLSGLWDPAREALDVYHEALDTYDADLAARRATLEEQASALDAQLADLERQIAQLESESREAASRGDLDAAAEADEKAEALRKKAATARRKRRIATAAELRGDAALYERIVATRAAYGTTYDLCAAAAREAAGVISAWSKRAVELERTAKLSALRGPVECGADGRRFGRISASFCADTGPSGGK